MRSISKMAVVLALVCSLGAHWAILQSIAWVSMLVQFSQCDSLTVALVKTFDGQHPCSICHFVDAGKKAEQQTPPQVIKMTQTELFLEFPYQFDIVAPIIPLGAITDETYPAHAEPPPLPPPRMA